MNIIKKISLLLFVSIVVTVISGCSSLSGSTAAYQSIGATETGVILANQSYLDLVVTGQVSTNGVIKVEAAFNDTQIVLRAAAALAAGGTNAPVPAVALAKASDFTNTVNVAKLVK